MVPFAHFKHLGIILQGGFYCIIRIIKSLLNHTCKIFYILKMQSNVLFAHYQTYVSDLPQIIFIKILFPVKWYITPFNNEILRIFNSSFNDFTYNWPQILC